MEGIVAEDVSLLGEGGGGRGEQNEGTGGMFIRGSPADCRHAAITGKALHGDSDSEAPTAVRGEHTKRGCSCFLTTPAAEVIINGATLCKLRPSPPSLLIIKVPHGRCTVLPYARVHA